MQTFEPDQLVLVRYFEGAPWRLRRYSMPCKKTKAEIGNRREATAMATAYAAVRQRDALADRMGEGRKWKTVKAIPWLMDVFEPSRGMYSQVGRKLSELSQRMGYPVHEVEDSTYGAVKAYHIAVIALFHVAIRKDPAMLGKYRKA